MTSSNTSTTVANPRPEPAVVTQAKKEARRLLNLASGTNGSISIKNLAEAQDVVSRLKGKDGWHDLITNKVKDGPDLTGNTDGVAVMKPESDIGISFLVAELIAGGRAEDIVKFFGEYMPETSRDGVLTGGALSLLRLGAKIVSARCSLDGSVITVSKLRLALGIESIVAASLDRRMPDGLKNDIRQYLSSLPGYINGKEDQPGAVRTRHGYLRMQLEGMLRKFHLLTQETGRSPKARMARKAKARLKNDSHLRQTQ